ncbi:hypothetical protein M5X06_22395 [Paenibacillus alvei]|uniref:Uncharacterized protein n=1 Tax=Paenibacillus alvei TaxID=44250 RepID=A0ABT4H2P1_PAEAL|nr:hypothetical protein [Paenibacillus alvei]MCY9763169.1 hypothetical protein [Paenibacillus alvei]MCY9769540.1 hypothetical protein [Paenibacillus alvei]
MGGEVWPVIIRRWGGGSPSEKMIYEYPYTYFFNLKNNNRLYVYAETKTERIKVLKMLIDKLMAGEINIHLYHLGIFILYPYLNTFYQDQSEAILGKKRLIYIASLPRMELKSNDDFLSSVWSDLIDRHYPEVGEEVVRVPLLSEIRMLFTSDRFGNYTGTHFYDADWVEPIYGNRLDVKRWVKEKDPMTPEPKKEGMLEGHITLGHEGGGNGLRHFVSGKAIRSGSYIEVKFGDGWISGRYEWSFQQGDLIQIHSSRDEFFYIREGSLVRVRK